MEVDWRRHPRLPLLDPFLMMLPLLMDYMIRWGDRDIEEYVEVELGYGKDLSIPYQTLMV